MRLLITFDETGAYCFRQRTMPEVVRISKASSMLNRLPRAVLSARCGVREKRPDSVKNDFTRQNRGSRKAVRAESCHLSKTIRHPFVYFLRPEIRRNPVLFMLDEAIEQNIHHPQCRDQITPSRPPTALRSTTPSLSMSRPFHNCARLRFPQLKAPSSNKEAMATSNPRRSRVKGAITCIPPLEAS